MALRNFTNTDRKFGVEIEATGLSCHEAAEALTRAGIACRYEGYNHQTRRTWKIVTDASVRGGFEAVSPVLRGEEGLAEVKRVCEALVAAGATVNRSCGTHVHLDAADLDLRAVKNLFKLWVKYEDSIDLLQPPSRRGSANTYCRSNVLGDGRTDRTAAVNDTMRAIGRCRSMEEIARVYQGSRYHKLNIQSFWRHGTIEIRQHAGTLNGQKLTSWVRLMMALFTAAKESTSVQPRRDNGQTAKFRLKWFFNSTIQGEVRRFFSRRARQLAA